MAFTVREQEILDKVKCVMPANFIAESPDDKILCFADLVINDYNWFPPLSGYTRETWPPEADGILVIGVQLFALFFKQMEATLQDFDYNDSGLSVKVDQVGKISQVVTASQGIFSIYKSQVEYSKKALLLRTGGQGLGTPKYQSQIGQFLKIALGSSFTWNS